MDHWGRWMPVSGAREAVGLPLFNVSHSLHQLCCKWERTPDALASIRNQGTSSEFSENLSSIQHYNQNKNNKRGCLNKARELEESQYNRIIKKINATTSPEKENPKHTRYRSPLLQKDTGELEKVHMWTMINIDNILWREIRNFKIKRIMLGHIRW